MFTCISADESAPQAFACLCNSPAFARLNALIDGKFSRRSLLAGAAAVVGAAAPWPKEASAAIPAAPKSPAAFTNVRLFDGKSKSLIEGKRVIVEGNKIKSVEDAASPLGTGVLTIDGGGRTLMPGLIDAHWHSMMAALPMLDLMTADVGFINLAAAEEARRTLLRGFTSIRDLAGPSFGLKRAIDSGLTAGPRIWPSGAMISQTSGHGDFRLPYEVPAQPNAPLSRGEAVGGGMIADGVDQVLKRAREQLMLGASQLKLAAGGAIRGGVRCIDHGQLMDEETARIMADKGIWFSSQAFIENEYSNPYPEGSANRAKQRTMFAGTDRAYGLAKQYKLKTAWGTDILFNPKMTKNQGAILATMSRWYANDEILTMATSANAELLAMSGPRNPYPGKIGVIEAGAYADLLLLDGNPTADIKLIADPEKNLKIVMKDGRIYKNTLAG